MSLPTISLSPLCTLELSPPDFVLCAAEAGYTHVNLRLQPSAPGHDNYFLYGDTPLSRETERRMRECGVRCGECEVLSLRPANKARNFLPYFEACARFGGTRILVACFDPVLPRATDTIGELCDMGLTCGVEVNLEYMPHSSIKTAGMAADVVRKLTHANLGVVFDAVQHFLGRSALNDLRSLSGHIRVMHICDGSGELPDALDAILYQVRQFRLSPGAGKLPLREYLGCVPPETFTVVEIPNDPLRIYMSPIDRCRMYREDSERILQKFWNCGNSLVQGKPSEAST